jgi:hypothetical protein
MEYLLNTLNDKGLKAAAATVVILVQAKGVDRGILERMAELTFTNRRYHQISGIGSKNRTVTIG